MYNITLVTKEAPKSVGSYRDLMKKYSKSPYDGKVDEKVTTLVISKKKFLAETITLQKPASLSSKMYKDYHDATIEAAIPKLEYVPPKRPSTKIMEALEPLTQVFRQHPKETTEVSNPFRTSSEGKFPCFDMFAEKMLEKIERRNLERERHYKDLECLFNEMEKYYGPPEESESDDEANSPVSIEVNGTIFTNWYRQ